MKDMVSLEDIFNMMIDLEVMGNKLYMEMQLLTTDDELAQLFGKLAQQEEAHKNLYETYKRANIAPNVKAVNRDNHKYLSAMLSGTHHFLKENNEVKDFDQGFRIAVNLEKDTLLFLTELRQIMDPAYEEILESIMNEERGHLKFLYEYLVEK